MPHLIPCRLVMLGMGLAAVFPVRADTVVTARGQKIEGRELAIADGQLVIPARDKQDELRLSLADLQTIDFLPGKPQGELKSRFVRVELPGSGKTLSLAEVQVFSAGRNIAVEGKAVRH